LTSCGLVGIIRGHFGLLCEGYDASNEIEIEIEIEISVEETKPEDVGGGEYLVDWLVG